MHIDDLTIDLTQTVEIIGTVEDVFEKVLFRLGEGNATPSGDSLNLIIEPFAGGRWYRDRGNGVQHLWGHVQAIKAPVLIEFCGPLFMSYPVINHVEVKLTANENKTTVTLRHRAVGMIDPLHRGSFNDGWKTMLARVVNDFQNAAGTNA